MNTIPVLGLLGPAGSGKDLTADWFVNKNNFVKISFADPIKRFVHGAFNIPISNLWGDSHLRNQEIEINDSWWMQVIGHFGEASEEIINHVLEKGVKVEGYLKLHDWLTNLRKAYPTKISARVILQTLGTEWGRAVDPIMWVKYAFKVTEAIQNGAYYNFLYGPILQGNYLSETGFNYNRDPLNNPNYKGIIIPDHRFKNEVQYTKSVQGHVIRLRRLSMEKSAEIGISGHRSEAEQKELPDNIFDAVLEFDEGIDNVHSLLQSAYDEKVWDREWNRDDELECNVMRLHSPSVPATVV